MDPGLDMDPRHLPWLRASWRRQHPPHPLWHARILARGPIGHLRVRGMARISRAASIVIRRTVGIADDADQRFAHNDGAVVEVFVGLQLGRLELEPAQRKLAQLLDLRKLRHALACKHPNKTAEHKRTHTAQTEGAALSATSAANRVANRHIQTLRRVVHDAVRCARRVRACARTLEELRQSAAQEVVAAELIAKEVGRHHLQLQGRCGPAAVLRSDGWYRST